jgi:hypothetical protein
LCLTFVVVVVFLSSWHVVNMMFLLFVVSKNRVVLLE